MKNKYIKIFATGGTFDKEFNEINGELYFKEKMKFVSIITAWEISNRCKN